MAGKLTGNKGQRPYYVNRVGSHYFKGSALLASDPIFGGLGVALISGTVAAVFVSLLFVPVLMDNTKAINASGV